MSLTIRDGVAEVRSLVTGSLVDELSVLSVPYDPNTDSSITLRYPKRNLGVGSTICVGLNTCQVMGTDGSGTLISVLPGVDGGPLTVVPEGEFIRIKPQLTTWAALREISNEIQGLSSRGTGLFAVYEYEVTALDRQSGTYPLPDSLDGREVFRLLRFEYRYAGTTTWQQSTDAEYQSFDRVIRVFQDPPGAIEYRFSLATTFGQVTGLDQTFASIGITEAQDNIPTLGAASTMVLGWAARRQQPLSQGDSRRAAENPGGSIVQMSQVFRRAQQENINDEVARLQAKYTYRTPAVSGQTAYGRYGTYGGWR